MNNEMTVPSNGKFIIPENYNSCMNLKETEAAIKLIKDFFQNNLAKKLNLTRVSAPLIVLSRTGVNDHLTGKEKPVSFNVKDIGEQGEIVQSLAKWKRKALADYDFKKGEGLYTDMNAIRPDEILDNTHSIYVDQWDWELVVDREERRIEFLKSIVNKIYAIIRVTEQIVCEKYKCIEGPFLPSEIYFIHSEELKTKYPNLSMREREDAICKEKGAVFIIGIGAKILDQEAHDDRAADYDDWSTETVNGFKGLNGDIIIWNPVLKCAFELSSMGIRVDKESLKRQLEIRQELHKLEFEYHQKLINDEFPLTIGGGIGQSRLCMLFLRKAHIGEVQSSVWSENMIETCRNNNIFLL